MNRIILLISFLSLMTFSYAQQNNSLHGHIIKINSGHKPLAEVQVQADSATATLSDINGGFWLVFFSKIQGKNVILKLTPKDEDWVVVNESDLITKIPDNPNQQILNIFMCLKKERVQTRMKYYNISDSIIRAKYIQKINQLSKEREDFELLAEQLTEERDKLLSQAYLLSEKFSRTNFDDAKPLQRKADSLFKEGKLDEVLRLLESINPNKRIALAKKQITKGVSLEKEGKEMQKEADSIINENISILISTAEYYTMNFQWDRAEVCYDSAVMADTSNLNNLLSYLTLLAQQRNLDKIKFYSQIGLRLCNRFPETEIIYMSAACLLNMMVSLTYLLNGNRMLSMQYLKEAERIKNKVFAFSEIGDGFMGVEITLYESFSSYFITNRDYDNAEIYLKKAEDAIKPIALKDSARYTYLSVGIYQDLSSICAGRGNFVSAAYYDSLALKAYAAFTTDASSDPKLANLFSTSALNLFSLNRFNEGEDLYNKAIVIHEKLASTNFYAYADVLASEYGVLSLQFILPGDTSKGLYYVKKALEIHQRFFNKNPHDFNKRKLAQGYNSVAYQYLFRKDYNNAELYYTKSIEILLDLSKQKNNDLNIDLAGVYSFLGQLFLLKGDNENAEKYLTKSLNIFLNDSTANNQVNSIVKGGLFLALGNLYKSMNDFENSRNYLTRSIQKLTPFVETDPQTVNPKLASACFSLGLLYFDVSYEKSKTNLLKAYEIYDNLAKHAPKLFLGSFSQVSFFIGELENKYGNPVPAKEFLEKAIEINEYLLKTEIETDSLSLATVYLEYGSLLASVEYIEKAISIYNSFVKTDPETFNRMLADAFLGSGDLYFSKKEYNTAEKYYYKSIDIYKYYFEKSPKVFAYNLLLGYSKIGFIEREKSDIKKAVQAFEDALQYTNGISSTLTSNQRQYIALLHLNLGILYQYVDLYKSILNLKKAYDLSDKIAPETDQVVARNFLLIVACNLGKSCFLMNNMVEAEHYFKACLISDSSGNPIIITDNSTRADIYVSLAMICLNKGEISLSDDYAGKCLTEYNKIPVQPEGVKSFKADIAIRLGDFFSNKKDTAATLKYYKEAYSVRKEFFLLNPNNSFPISNAAYRLGNYYLTIGNFNESENYLMESLKIRETITESLFPKSSIAESLLGLGTLYINKGEYNKSKLYLLRSIALYKSVNSTGMFDYFISESNIRVATVYFRLKDFEPAKQHLDSALQINKKYELIAPNKSKPKKAEIFAALGLIYYDEKEYVKSEDCYVQAIKEVRGLPNKNQFSEKWYGLIQFYSRQGAFEKAIPYLDELITLDPLNAGNWKFAAVMYQENKNPIKALEYYEKAIDLNPNSEYYLSRALVYKNLGDLKKAKSDLTEAGKGKSKNNYWYYISWSTIYSLEKKKDKAIENLKKAIEIGFNNVTWINNENSLDYIRHEAEFKMLMELMQKNQYL